MDLLTAIEIFGMMDTSEWSPKEREAHKTLCLHFTDIITEFMDEQGIEYERKDYPDYTELDLDPSSDETSEEEENNDWLEVSNVWD